MLIRGTDEEVARTLTRIGALTFVVLAVIGVVLRWSPWNDSKEENLAIVIEAPFVGQGVDVGSSFLLHGVPVGQVTGIASMPGGGVRIDGNLLRKDTAGLTDALHIDYRPSNYFGITAINLNPSEGGTVITDNTKMRVIPDGNFTIQALLSRLGSISSDVITPRLITVVNKVTRFTDGLNPLIEVFLVVGNAVAKTQSVSTERLMANSAAISDAFPEAIDGVLRTVDSMRKPLRPSTSDPKYFWDNFYPGIQGGVDALFGSVGGLLHDNQATLQSLSNVLIPALSAVPAIAQSEAIAGQIGELRRRLETMYANSSDQHALQVRVQLDALSGGNGSVNQPGGGR
ncbi:hypothetical protein ABQF35_05170 [Mycobacterium syngnathidarum]